MSSVCKIVSNAWKENRNHMLFSALNLSHASFSVPNTALEIMRCSVVAVVEI